jgi:hypothetical protein
VNRFYLKIAITLHLNITTNGNHGNHGNRMTIKQPLFLINYTRPTYKGVVQVSYFWVPGLGHGGTLIKLRMY